MKKTIALLLAAVMLLSLLSACKSGADAPVETKPAEAESTEAKTATEAKPATEGPS